MFNFGLRPGMDGPGSNLKDCRSRQLSLCNIAGEGIKMYAQLFGSLPCGNNLHSTTSVDDRGDVVKRILRFLLGHAALSLTMTQAPEARNRLAHPEGERQRAGKGG